MHLFSWGIPNFRKRGISLLVDYYFQRFKYQKNRPDSTVLLVVETLKNIDFQRRKSHFSEISLSL